MLGEIGFVEAVSLGESGFKSSRVTMGMVFAAVKPEK